MLQPLVFHRSLYATKSQVREINQEKTSSTEKKEEFSDRLDVLTGSLQAEEHQLWHEGHKREHGAVVNPNSTP